ncbi:MAG: type II toxin-antitoxin system RelE/ParE family toxin [Pseudomonadota bacterium]
MTTYRLTLPAEDDLRKIARYSLDTWGPDQARRYGDALEAHFRGIAAQNVQIKSVTPKWPYLYVSRCQHHCVFFLRDGSEKPTIIAVLHEKMDMLHHLTKRF